MALPALLAQNGAQSRWRMQVLLVLLLVAMSVRGVRSETTITTTEVEEDEIIIKPSKDDTMKQFSLGEFEIQLKPTPEPLTDIDNVLGAALEDFLNTEFETEFGDAFEYMYVASVDRVDRFGGGNIRRQMRSLESTLPSTSVTYVGGVIAFGEDPNVNINQVIRDKITTDAFLNSLGQTGGGAWTLIQEVDFVSLDTDAPTTAPVAPVISGVSVGDTSKDDGSSRRGRLLGAIFGVAFVVIGAALLVDTSRRLKDKRIMTQHALASTMDESEKHQSQKSDLELKSDNADDGLVSESGDRSEMAHYSSSPASTTGVDAVSVAPSVASEWTMTTNDDTKISGGTLRHQSSGGANVWASLETFERDRQVTLQKDMLQSEWTTMPAPSTTRALTSSRYTTHGAQREPSPDLSFEQAYDEGQGEEIYLMPPSRTTRTRKGEMV